MKVKKSTLNNIVIASVILLATIGFLLMLSNISSSQLNTNVNAVSISGDKQIIDVIAKGGYSPSVITAEANKETILRVNTNNTFDCSSALTIPKLGIQKNLPVTGETEIVLGSQKPGTEIEGTCSMGMYSFKIKFV
jgi:plastocyanin domain-containing protein